MIIHLNKYCPYFLSVIISEDGEFQCETVFLLRRRSTYSSARSFQARRLRFAPTKVSSTHLLLRLPYIN